MDTPIAELIINAVRVDSIGSIIIRAIIWLIIVTIIAVGTAKGQKHSQIKHEVGFFIFFLILTGATIYLMFGIIPTVTTLPESSIMTGSLFAYALNEFYQLGKTGAYSPQT